MSDLPAISVAGARAGLIERPPPLDLARRRPTAHGIVIGEDTAAATAEPAAGEALAPSVPAGPVLLAYDGSPAAGHALREAARLLAERRALVLVVWQAGIPFELLELPSMAGVRPAPVDIRTALQVEESVYESARRLAAAGACIGREAGLGAEPVVVADAPSVPVAHTIVRVARERQASAVVLGERAHGRLGEMLLGSVSREVIHRAPCPVLVVRHDDTEGRAGR